MSADERSGDETEDYYAEVERHFVSLRGSPLFVSPAEWQLIHRWREAQIPLRIAKQGLDHAFANRKSRRPIRRLSYCRQAVEASYRRFREAIAGAGPGREERTAEGRSNVHDYLNRLITKLIAAGNGMTDVRSPMRESIDRVVKQLSALDEASKEPLGLDELERELGVLEAALVETAESVLDPAERAACREAAELSLRDYRDRMPRDVLESAQRSAYLKRVRSRFDLPALSLFYL
ncbi:MAG: hypothetical protein ACRD1X_18600, partial [Vicinamibacteria bacterium]